MLTADQADSIFCFYNDLPVALEVQGIAHSTMLLADFGYNPASQVYTVLTESLSGRHPRPGRCTCCGPRSSAGRTTRRTTPRPPSSPSTCTPTPGSTCETQQVQAEVQLDIMYSDVTDENGFAWFTDEIVEDNMELFADLGIEGATAELFDRSLLEEIYADGPTI